MCAIVRRFRTILCLSIISITERPAPPYTARMSRGNGRADRVREHVGFALRLLLWTALLSLLSFLAASAQPYQGYVPIWPSGGVGLALIWRHGARYWPAIVVSSMALSMSVGTM